MRLLLAARLSTQRDGQSGIDTQDQDARSWAEWNGHTVIATAADRISGRVAPFKRPNLGPWLNDAVLREKYDGIIVSKIDRLTRGRDWGIRQWAEDHGKKLIVVSPELMWPPERGDTATSIVWDNLVNIASAEWDYISIRNRRDQQYRRDIGSIVGRRPFGYQIVKEGGVKTLAPDPVEAAAINTVVQSYMEGQSLRQLCEYLHDAGVLPQDSKRWYPKSLSQVLRNPVLAGRRTDSKGRTILKFTGILDRPTWDALQAELDRKAARKGVVSGAAAMLTGVLVCMKCGGPMYRHDVVKKRKDGSKAQHRYYRCHGSGGTPSTCRNMYPLRELEERVHAYMAGPLARWPRYEIVTIPGHGHEEEVYEVERDIRELDFDDPDFSTKQSALLAERVRLKALPGVPSTTEKRKTGDTIGQYWATLNTDAEKRAFLLKLGMVARVNAEDRDVAFEVDLGQPEFVRT